MNFDRPSELETLPIPDELFETFNDKSPLRNNYFKVISLERSKTSFKITNEGRLWFLHFAVDSHPIAEALSNLITVSLECTKDSQSISCEGLDPIDHIVGPLSYRIKETTVEENCSIIHEKGSTDENKRVLFDKTYALDPRRTLPHFLSQLAITCSFYNNIRDLSTPKNTNAKVDIPLNFPDLPSTCEELRAEKKA